MNDKQTAQIEELEAKLTKYETLLEQTLSEKKSISKIAAGPFEFEGSQFYRVSGEASSSLMCLSADPIFGLRTEDVLEIGSEVICVGSTIIDIVPAELTVKKEATQFNLIDWSSVGGLNSQIESIRAAIELPLQNAELAKELGISPLKGLLLFGPPGCGKTLIAKAIASSILKSTTVDADAFIYIKGAELLSQYVGATEQKIVSMFRNCREYTKRTGNRAVIFIDEAEAILPKRGSMRSSDVDKTIVPTFLSEMDGFEDNNPIILLSTNLPKNIDDAILREGRIDIKIGIERPNYEDSKDIFKIHLSKAKLVDKMEDLILFGTDTIFACEAKHNISGAMIETVVNGAGRHAMSRIVANKKSPKGIIQEDLKQSINLINSHYVTV